MVQEIESWRPDNWGQISNQIIRDTPITFSPSQGYSGDQKRQLIEKTANAIIKAYKESEEYLALLEQIEVKGNG